MAHKIVGDSITVLDSTNTQHRIRPRKNDRLRSRLRRDLGKDGPQGQVRTAEILKFRVSADINTVIVSAFEIS